MTGRFRTLSIVMAYIANRSEGAEGSGTQSAWTSRSKASLSQTLAIINVREAWY